MRVLTNVSNDRALKNVLHDLEKILFENVSFVYVTHTANIQELVMEDHKVEIVSLENLMSFSFTEDMVTLIDTEQNDSIYLFLVSGCGVVCPTYLVHNGSIIRLTEPPIPTCFYPLLVASISKLVQLGKAALGTDFDRMVGKIDYEHLKKSFDLFDETFSQLLGEHLKKELDGVFKK